MPGCKVLVARSGGQRAEAWEEFLVQQPSAREQAGHMATVTVSWCIQARGQRGTEDRTQSGPPECHTGTHQPVARRSHIWGHPADLGRFKYVCTPMPIGQGRGRRWEWREQVPWMGVLHSSWVGEAVGCG